MKESLPTREILRHALEEEGLAGLISVALFTAYSKCQKEWIRERDGEKCQFPVKTSERGYVPCGRKTNLQVHHAIVPQRWGKDRGYREEELDTPENGVTICEQHHQGVIHNDMLAAKLAYGQNKNSFKETFDVRNILSKMGVPYWFYLKDWDFQKIINKGNRSMDRPFPYKRGQQQRIRKEKPITIFGREEPRVQPDEKYGI